MAMTAALLGGVGLHGQSTVTITVPQALYTIQEGQPLQVLLTAQGGTDTNYVFEIVSVHPSGPALAGRTLSWTPGYQVATATQPQTVQFTVAVANAAGERATAIVNVLVTNANRPPVVGNVPNLYARAGVPIDQIITGVSDPDADRLTFAKVGSWPEDANIASDGKISWVPSLGQISQLPRTVQFEVSDGTSSTTGSFTIEKSQIGEAPRVTLINGPREIEENQAATWTIGIADADGLSGIDLSVAATPLSVSGNLSGTGDRHTYTWTPNYGFVQPPATSAPVRLTFSATDPTRQVGTLVVDLTVLQVANPNQTYDQYRATLTDAAAALLQMESRERALRRSIERRTVWEKGSRILLGLASGFSAVIGHRASEGDLTTTAIVSSGVGLAVAVVGNEIGSSKERREELTQLVAAATQVREMGSTFANRFSTAIARGEPTFAVQRGELVTAVAGARAKNPELGPILSVAAADLQRFFPAIASAP